MISELKNLLRAKISQGANGSSVKTKPLSSLNLTLTYQCQLKCSMCGQVEAPEDAPNSQLSRTQLPLELIKERINRLKDKLGSVYLFGGEPLVYKDMFKLSEFLTNKQIPFSYSTNGLLLKKYTQEIIENPPSMISVSMDGCTPETHDAIRKVPGSWQKAMDGIGSLLDARDRAGASNPEVKIHFTITPANYLEIPEFFEFYTTKFPTIDLIKFHVPRFSTREMGMEYHATMKDNFGVECLSYLGNFSENDFVTGCCNDIDTEKLYSLIQAVLSKPKSAYLGPTDKEELHRYFKDPSFVPKEKLCACKRTFSVQPNGDISGCGDFPDLTFGNMHDDDLSDVWESEQAVKWRRFLKHNSHPGVLAKCSRLFKTTYGPTRI